MSVRDKILALTNQLYPTGRAFKMTNGGTHWKLHNALSISEARAYEDALSILDSAIPDNDNFTAEDATQWEQRLGLITNPLVALSIRKQAIIRKMNHPGTIKARQHYLYIEGQLQAAGFDVYVYENLFDDGMGGYETQTPTDFSIPAYPIASQQHSDFVQHGDIQHGGSYGNKVVNNIYQTLDDSFDTGSDLFFTFFIGGSMAGSWADVDAEREAEFRQLILKLKPANTAAFLLVNYI